jgi:hypothetical protein
LQHRIHRLRSPAVGTSPEGLRSLSTSTWATSKHNAMHEIIYLVGLVVVVMFILGLIGVR